MIKGRCYEETSFILASVLVLFPCVLCSPQCHQPLKKSLLINCACLDIVAIAISLFRGICFLWVRVNCFRWCLVHDKQNQHNANHVNMLNLAIMT